MSYAHLPQHDTETFEKWTVDGDYVWRNFPNPEDVYVVTDSDEIMLVGLTKESDLHYEFIENPVLSLPRVGARIRAQIISHMKHSDVMDPLKRRISDLPVRIHEGDINGKWRKVERRARAVLTKTVTPPTAEQLYRTQIWAEAFRAYEARASGLEQRVVGLKIGVLSYVVYAMAKDALRRKWIMARVAIQLTRVLGALWRRRLLGGLVAGR
jgi:hypothetical protein